MTWVIVPAAAILVAAVLYEFRVRQPDHFVLYESRGEIKRRAKRFYPRHFSLAVPATAHALLPEISAEARGQLALNIRPAVSVGASSDHLPDLIRAGGWSPDTVARAAADLEIHLGAMIREYTEKFEIEELSAERLTRHLSERLPERAQARGLELLDFQIRSIEPASESISEAMQKQESDRIMEKTEAAGQKARAAAARSRLEADALINASEHELGLKRLELQREQDRKEAGLARERTEQELALRRMKLDVDKEEMEILRNNPELMLLTPQVARLAEASQSLRGAKTVVSLAPSDLGESSPLINVIRSMLEKLNPANQKDPDHQK